MFDVNPENKDDDPHGSTHIRELIFATGNSSMFFPKHPTATFDDQRVISLLVGGLEHFLFSPIAGMMIQSDFHIFQRD